MNLPKEKFLLFFFSILLQTFLGEKKGKHKINYEAFQNKSNWLEDFDHLGPTYEKQITSNILRQKKR